MILPLALAQFIASYAATNMNVAISAIAEDLGTTVSGVQTAITLFTLTMAALMIPGSKLTDIWGRKRCFVLGLAVYAVGGLLAALAQGLPLLIAGYSLLEGVGSALMIPPIYILVTVTFPDVKSRARYFGVVSGAGGLGAAAGPLIGGLVTSAFSWRASFGLQVLVVAWIIVLARKITDPAPSGSKPRFDLTGAVLSAAGLFFVVLGLLQSRTYGFAKSRQDFTIGGTVVIPKGSISPVWLYVAIGALFLLWFFLHIRSGERKGRDVLLPLRLFRNKVANLGLGTQTIQWLILQGCFFVVSVYLQEVGYRRWHDLAAVPGPGPRGHLALDTRAAAVRHRSRDHADLPGQRGPVQLPGQRSGRHLRPVPQRVQPGLLTRHCLGWLGPGRRQTARRQAICRGPRHDAGLRLDRPGHRRPHSPPASRGHRTTILSGGVCA
jgi:MFS family permease